MTPPVNSERYTHHRFPGDIISHGVWLYYRVHLSYRDVQELLFARGIDVTYEAIRHWCRKFGQDYAHQLRRRRPRPGDTWHLDEVFLTIKASVITCGERWIRTTTSSTSWCSVGGIRRPPRSSFASCSRA